MQDVHDLTREPCSPVAMRLEVLPVVRQRGVPRPHEGGDLLAKRWSVSVTRFTPKQAQVYSLTALHLISSFSVLAKSRRWPVPIARLERCFSLCHPLRCAPAWRCDRASISDVGRAHSLVPAALVKQAQPSRVASEANGGEGRGGARDCGYGSERGRRVARARGGLRPRGKPNLTWARGQWKKQGRGSGIRGRGECMSASRLRVFAFARKRGNRRRQPGAPLDSAGGMWSCVNALCLSVSYRVPHPC